MNATNHEVIDALTYLLTELADKEIAKGAEFCYQGAPLLAMDVAEMGMNATMALVDHLHRALGLGETGLSFTLVPAEDTLAKYGQFFPLIMDISNSKQAFSVLASLVVEVFKVEVMECRDDLFKLFERASCEITRVQSLRVADAPLPAALLPFAAETRALLH